MSSNVNLPPYSAEAPPGGIPLSSTHIIANRISGNVQTCSIKDFQVDYLKIVRESATSYHICLSVDPTPIYRIMLVPESTKLGDIQIFPASDAALPAVAAARLTTTPYDKNVPLATLCTSEPHLPEAHWRPMSRASTFAIGEDYRSSMPIITVPGIAPVMRQFAWRTGLCKPVFELWWDGPLPLASSSGYVKGDRDFRYVFATVDTGTAGTGYFGHNLIEIRRGGGLEFELSVVLETFVILQHLKKELV